MARPRKYANDAEKMAAFRARWPALTVNIEAETIDTIRKIAEAYDVSQSEVANQLFKFALLNRNWLSGVAFPNKRLPKANPLE